MNAITQNQFNDDCLTVELPEKLHFLLTEPARYKIIYGGRGGAKCLALGTKVIMYDGTLRNIENIWPGELVMGPDNKSRKVLGTTRGTSLMYKVHQTSGIDYVVNSAHILSLKKSNASIKDIGEISKAGNARRPNGRYSGYSEITNINVIEAANKSKRWRENFRGYRAGLLNFEEKYVTINPWYLGLWLGDGKSDDAVIYTADQEIKDGCYDYANKLNLNVIIYNQPNNKSVGVRFRRKELKGNGKTSKFLQWFSQYNLWNNKHIPLDYLTNSEEIRLQVLAGLIDSDGSVHNNGYMIAQTNERLAKNIKYLADTLGFRTSLNKRKTKCTNNGVTGEAFYISISGDTWRVPCKVERKKIKKEDIHKNKDFLLSQIKIECVGEGEYAGFVLDGDHLFLLEDGTVTHNTETVARSLIIFAMQMKLRIACFREFQNSIKESVYETIKLAISDMNLQSQFDFKIDKIICTRTGAEFIFYGLRYNIESIKSLARIDIAWIEEARNVSKISLDKLGPTIRGRHEDDPNGMGGPFGKGPEIWISFNPELDGDEIYKRAVRQVDKYFPEYVKNKKGELERYAIVVKINYWENKFFPESLRQEMEVAKVADHDTYMEVWEGNTKLVLAGAVYAKEIKKVILENRRGKVPYNSNKPVYTFWDLGHSDKTAIWFIQRIGIEYNIIDYYENRLEKMPHYIKYLQDQEYTYASHYLPHDGDAETLSNVTPKKQLQTAFPNANVKIVIRPSKKAVGINAARTVFDLCNFDEENTADGWQALCNYAYKVKEENGVFSKEPEHDTPWSHGCDGFQTFALSLKTETDTKKKEPKTVGSGNRMNMRGSNSWMG